MLSKELIKKKIIEACPLNYIVSEQKITNDEKMISFSKIIDDQNNAIAVAKLNGLYNNFIRNGNANIKISSIDNILYGIRKNDFDYTVTDHNINSIFPEVKPEDLKLNAPIIYNTEADIEEGIAYVKRYLKEFGEDYFAYWNDIRAFLPFLESNNIDFLNNLLVGKGENRKLIIWKLCNHPKYELFRNETFKSYEDYLQSNPNDNYEKRAFKEFKNVVKRLEKTSPLYEWDEKYLEPKPFKGVMPVIVY